MTTSETRFSPAFKSARTRSARNAAQVAVREIMTSEVVTVGPALDLESFAALLIERGLSRVPVADGQGRVVGVVSKTDLVVNQGRVAQGGTVGEIMVEPVLSLFENATIVEAARLMAGNNVHGAPVVTASGKLAGYLSAMDILAWLSGQR